MLWNAKKSDCFLRSLPCHDWSQYLQVSLMARNFALCSAWHRCFFQSLHFGSKEKKIVLRFQYAHGEMINYAIIHPASVNNNARVMHNQYRYHAVLCNIVECYWRHRALSAAIVRIADKQKLCSQQRRNGNCNLFAQNMKLLQCLC